MKYYQDITLIPDADVNLGFIWHKVYIQIHLALAENKIAENQSAIAVSFPNYGDKTFPLGDKLRLFAESEAQLMKLDINRWLSRLIDYSDVKPIKQVPESVVQYACFKRKNVKSAIKKTESLAAHLNKPVDDVLKFRKENNLYHDCNLPFVHMESQQATKDGVKHKFRLFIEQSFSESPVQEHFDCYGLSKTATVPWF